MSPILMEPPTFFSAGISRTRTDSFPLESFFTALAASADNPGIAAIATPHAPAISARRDTSFIFFPYL